jgi:hypothetical protein
MHHMLRFVASSTMDENCTYSDPIAGYADFSNDTVAGFTGTH